MTDTDIANKLRERASESCHADHGFGTDTPDDCDVCLMVLAAERLEQLGVLAGIARGDVELTVHLRTTWTTRAVCGVRRPSASATVLSDVTCTECRSRVVVGQEKAGAA